MPHYGFNFLWMFIQNPGADPPPADERALDFIAERGFNFVRLPTDYRFWTRDHDYLNPDEEILRRIDSYVQACRNRGLHVSLNLHRAPGYCINANHLEKHNLWLDAAAQDAFAFLWEMFARRYAGIPAEDLSFDLVNEPPGIGQYGMTRENHAAVMRRAAAAIRGVDPLRPIVIDGLGGGNIAMPELADLGAVHSTRGYQPMALTHYEAGWWSGRTSVSGPPHYPGLEWNGIVWDGEALRQHYEPWREVESGGVRVHVGEFGCYDKTPDDVALAWFTDLLGIYREFRWGYALWNFEGPFGIVNHGRPGAIYETVNGYNVDRRLLDLLLEHRVG